MTMMPRNTMLTMMTMATMKATRTTLSDANNGADSYDFDADADTEPTMMPSP
jgi:hypothetical protein